MASLLLGYHLEKRLMSFTSAVLGRTFSVLSDGLKEMDKGRRISAVQKGLFSDLLYLRNKAIHQPANVPEADFKAAIKKLDRLEETVP